MLETMDIAELNPSYNSGTFGTYGTPGTCFLLKQPVLHQLPDNRIVDDIDRLELADLFIGEAEQTDRVVDPFDIGEHPPLVNITYHLIAFLCVVGPDDLEIFCRGSRPRRLCWRGAE